MLLGFGAVVVTIAVGLSRTDNLITSFNQRLDVQNQRMDSRFDAQNQRFDEQNQRFDIQNQRFDRYYDLLMNHNTDIALIKEAQKEIRENIAEFNKRYNIQS
jgi:hypothetical protein